VTDPQGSERRFVAGSTLLQELHDRAPAGHFTLQWLMSSLRTHGHNIQEMRGTVAGFVQNPLDTAAQKLLVPAALSLLRGLRAKK
jgi:hypothetical protein